MLILCKYTWAYDTTMILKILLYIESYQNDSNIWIEFIVVFGKEAPELGKHLEGVQSLEHNCYWSTQRGVGLKNGVVRPQLRGIFRWSEDYINLATL